MFESFRSINNLDLYLGSDKTEFTFNFNFQFIIKQNILRGPWQFCLFNATLFLATQKMPFHTCIYLDATPPRDFALFCKMHAISNMCSYGSAAIID